MNGEKDGYRTDCSGYVSMAWNLSSSRTTQTLVNVCGREPIGKDDLQPGDVLIKNDPDDPQFGSHAVIFVGWVDASRTAYRAYEQTPPANRYVANVPYPYFGGDAAYLPYRYDNVIDSVPTDSGSLTLALQATSGQYVGVGAGDQAAVNATRDRIRADDVLTVLRQPGGRVSLRTNDGRYLSTARTSGDLRTRTGTVTASEVFEVRAEGPFGIQLQTADREHKVVAVGGGGGRVRADETGGPWTVFQPFAAIVALRASNGQFVSATGGGGGEARVDETSADTRQARLEMIPSGAGWIGLRTASRLHLLAAPGGGGRDVHAAATGRGHFGDDLFKIVPQPGNRVALRTYNGYYLTAEHGGGARLLATSDSIGPHQLFEITAVARP
jgi:hypothetical protein